MIISRPLNVKELDLLVGRENKTLYVKDLDGNEMKTIPSPNNGWTHDLLENINYKQISQFGWDAYLEDFWIGGSEV